MPRIAVAFGTRPEFLKLAPLISRLEEHEAFEVITVFTGQHAREVLGAELFFGSRPFDIELSVMRPGQSLADLNSRILSEVSLVLRTSQPDVCVVHGDTTTALSSAMASFYQEIPVAHVEAGLRTRNLSAPFPEEFNRQAIGRIAKWNFAPTAAARDNLIQEAVNPSTIFVTGNTVVDTIRSVVRRQKRDPALSSQLIEKMHSIHPSLTNSTKLILVTAHRRENHSFGIREISLGVHQFAIEHPEVTFLFAMHPNPIVQEVVLGLLSDLPNVVLTGPLGYGEFVYLLDRCTAVVTDSGGIQEEAVSLGKPVVVTRESTERGEGIQSGLLRIVGANSLAIQGALRQIDDEGTYLIPSSSHESPYGDGEASERIVAVLAGAPIQEFQGPDSIERNGSQ